MFVITRFFAVLILSVSTSLLADGPVGGIQIEDAWIAEAPPGARVLAGYMRLQNNSDHTIVINAISSTAARSSMLHKTVYEDGMARMVHQSAITLPAGGSVTLEPGGMHLMLMGPKSLKAGQQVPLTLEFANGRSRSFNAVVRRRDH